MLNAIAVLLPSINNAKQFLNIRLLPPHQFLRKLLENSHRHIQSSTSLPWYLPKHTSIKHHHFECDSSAAAIHWQWQTIPYHQAIASTLILAKMAWELAKIHPIKHELSLTPPKTHINHTSPFWVQLRQRWHPLTMWNNSLPSGYCLHIISRENCSRTFADTSNQARAFPHTYILR